MSAGVEGRRVSLADKTRSLSAFVAVRNRRLRLSNEKFIVFSDSFVTVS